MKNIISAVVVALSSLAFLQGATADPATEINSKTFLSLPEPAQRKLINAYQTFVVHVQWESSEVPQFKDGDYAVYSNPSFSLFSQALAQGSTCSPISQRTCVIAGNLSEMRPRYRKNAEQEDECIGYFCSKQGFTQGCSAGEVRCNPLLFIDSAGKSFCVGTSAPLGVTATCQQKTDQKELIDMLKKKLANSAGKKEYEDFEKASKKYCKNPHWTDRNKNSSFGACDVLERSLVDIWLGLKNQADRDTAYVGGEKTACLYQTPNNIGKVTVVRDESGNIISAQKYKYTLGRGKKLSGWILDHRAKFVAATRKPDGRAQVDFSLDGSIANKISFTTDKNEPGTCSAKGLESVVAEIRYPLDSLRDPNLAKSLDESMFLGEMDRILGTAADFDRGYQKKIAEGIALVKNRKGCKPNYTFVTGLGGILAPVAPGGKSFTLDLNQVKDGRNFDKMSYRSEITCKGGDWETMTPVQIGGCLVIKDSGKSLFADLQEKFCNDGGSSGSGPARTGL